MAVVFGDKRGAARAAKNKGYPKNKRMKFGHMTTTTGAPTHQAPLGTHNWDITNSDMYRNTDGGTTWAKTID